MRGPTEQEGLQVVVHHDTIIKLSGMVDLFQGKGHHIYVKVVGGSHSVAHWKILELG